MTVSPQQHLILIDGYGFVFRAYHAFPALENSRKVNVGALYGFTSMLIRLLLEHQCSHLAVVFDSGGKNFRHNIYPEYKSHRPPVPEDLIKQFSLIREAVSSLNIDILERPGFEADDLIATYAKLASNEGYQVTIFSSDKDLMQLVDDNISMFDPINQKKILQQQIYEKFGVNADQIRDFLSLIGDKADFIPGVPGIGPKTAADLLGRFGSLEKIYQNINLIEASKRKTSLIENHDKAMLSYQLVYLEDKVPLDIQLDNLRIKISDVEKFKAFLQEHNFTSLLNKADKICADLVQLNIKHHHPILSCKINKLEDLNLIKNWLESKVKNHNKLAIIWEMDIIAIAADSYEAVFIELDADAKSSFNQEFIKILVSFLDLATLSKIFHGKKDLFHRLNQYCVIPGLAWQADDVELMSYLLNNGVHNHDFKSLIKEYFSLPNDLDHQYWLGYCSIAILNLWHEFKLRLIKEKLLVLYEKIEKPLAQIIYNMEVEGIKLDIVQLDILDQDFSERNCVIEQQIYQHSGCQFNIGSPKQLGEVLFNKLGLKVKNNKNSTNNEVLETLSFQGNEIADLIIKWRHLSKLQNTYTRTLINNVDRGFRVHTSFQMTVTSTGRLSSVNPNLQNIPIRSEDGIKIRSAFVASADHVLLSADYSQIELRLLAHFSDDPNLNKAFNESQDIHTLTACEVFNLNKEMITDELRRKAKAINFGIIYGIGSFSLAKHLHVSNSDAAKYIEQYFLKFPKIKEYLESTKQFVRQNNYVETILGRRCYIKNINDPNFQVRNFAERMAINAPLQGSAADIIKKAMIELDRELNKNKLNGKILLQIHDELLLELPIEELEAVKNIVQEIMQGTMKLKVPLIVDLKYGKNWGEL